MNKDKENTSRDDSFKLSPSQFYRKLRPENFSDSEIYSSTKLTKEILAYELEKITTNQKENQFETLARKMAERLIVPNLIPQVGPTGGGDGKTDSETYPVSESVSDRWFIPENGWSKDEKWAFAISAKEAWKSKLKSDIKNILSTKREYTRVYFITNQTPSSKRKKDTQDDYILEFDIDIVILDGKWILENVYTHGLINLVVDSLSLSSSLKEKDKLIGPNDLKRENSLKEIENNISNPNRYSEYDFQLVEDALESAILARQLEKPRSELEGRFDRVERLLKKNENLGQKIRLKYQKAWTYVNYYDDYKSFLREFKELKKLISSYLTMSSLEFYSTLFTLLRNIYLHDNKIITKELFLKEKEEFYSFLNQLSLQEKESSVSLSARMYLNINKSHDLFDNIDEVEKLFIEMSEILVKARNRLEFPFEQFQRIINVLGNVFVDSKEFDNLYDTIVNISEERDSEMIAGQLNLNRAGQKMESKKYRDALVYFGKAISKLSKNESQLGFYLASIGLSEAYSRLGLFNASYSSKVVAISILLKPWFDEGNLDFRILKVLDSLLSEEILYGRIPHIFTWHQMYKVIYNQFINQIKVNDVERLTKFDAFVSIRLLNEKIEKNTLEYLPAILAKEEFLLSEDTSLFLLGYYNKILSSFKKIDVKTEEDLECYYQKVSDQPLNQQFTGLLNFIEKDKSVFLSNILGCRFILTFNTSNSLVISAEMILAYIEAFLGTSFENLFPNSEVIEIELIDSKNEFRVEYMEKANSYKVYWDSAYDSTNNINVISKCCLDLITKVLSRNYLIYNIKEYLEELFKNQEVNERISVVLNHKTFLTNVLGSSPKLTFNDWISAESKKMDFKRDQEFIPNFKIKVEDTKTKKRGKTKDLSMVPHNKRKVVSIINNKLWDEAKWKGAGVFPSNDGVGLIIGFENIEFGEKIFREWIQRFGIHDKENKIKVSIITEIDEKNPHWYNILFSSNFEEMVMEEGEVFIAPSRFHLMNATSGRNIEILKQGFGLFKKFRLYPGQINQDLSLKISNELFLEKTEITFVKKKNIKQNDIESIVIFKDIN